MDVAIAVNEEDKRYICTGDFFDSESMTIELETTMTMRNDGDEDDYGYNVAASSSG